MPGMLLNRLLVRGDVDTVDLVLYHVAVEPLNLRAKLIEDAAGLLRNGPQLLRGEPPAPGISRNGHKMLNLDRLSTRTRKGLHRKRLADVLIGLEERHERVADVLKGLMHRISLGDQPLERGARHGITPFRLRLQNQSNSVYLLHRCPFQIR